MFKVFIKLFTSILLLNINTILSMAKDFPVPMDKDIPVPKIIVVKRIETAESISYEAHYNNGREEHFYENKLTKEISSEIYEKNGVSYGCSADYCIYLPILYKQMVESTNQEVKKEEVKEPKKES